MRVHEGWLLVGGRGFGKRARLRGIISKRGRIGGALNVYINNVFFQQQRCTMELAPREKNKPTNKQTNKLPGFSGMKYLHSVTVAGRQQGSAMPAHKKDAA